MGKKKKPYSRPMEPMNIKQNTCLYVGIISWLLVTWHAPSYLQIFRSIRRHEEDILGVRNFLTKILRTTAKMINEKLHSETQEVTVFHSSPISLFLKQTCTHTGIIFLKKSSKNLCFLSSFFKLWTILPPLRYNILLSADLTTQYYPIDPYTREVKKKGLQAIIHYQNHV